jgi:murein DD-endopeptidase MepM/ murein hydrolase activator NlpD
MRSLSHALIAFVAVILGGTAAASAQTADAPPAPEGSEPADRKEKDDPLRLRLESVSPQKVFFGGRGPATFTYEIGGGTARDLTVEVVRRGGRVIRDWHHENVEPGRAQTQTWGGKLRRKRAAKSGRYLFRVRTRRGALAERAAADGDRSFGYYDHVFPIRGKHKYGDGVGARRRGHRHQGQDLFARCGAPLVAARAGKVQYKGYQGGGAGHYVVVDGRKTGRDYVYMHLRREAEVRTGKRVRTGERLGEVGESGNASGCHLHFELWSKPGWYDGGRYLRSVTKKLRRWDRWS